MRDEGPWQLVYCWPLVPRRLIKRVETEASPIAEEKLRQTVLLHQIEKTERGHDLARHLAARRDQSAPIVAALKP